MGLFKKKIKMPSDIDRIEIEYQLQRLNSYNNGATKVNDVDLFINDVTSIKEIVENLIKYEIKYPNYFNPKPSEILKNFKTNNKLILEKNFIDRYIISIERKLLDYSTMRGKTNNFNKKVDLFRYYAGEFEPENVNYFERCLIERFPEYLQ